MLNEMVIFSLLFGFSGWLIHLFFITMSLRSKTKGLIEIYYNKYKELYIEIFFISGLVIFELITLITFIRIL